MTDQIKSPDLQVNENLIDELYSDVTISEGTLAGGVKLKEGGAALHSLKETKVQFGNPRANLVAITADQLHGSGIELSSIQKQQLEGTHDFYFMTMTVDMRPQPGAHFSALACELNFGPKGANEPIVQSIFPKTSWKNVMTFGGGMNLGLDADLNWKVGVDASKLSELTDKAPELSANLENKNDMKSHIVLHDFSYDLGRFDIAAYGEDNSECYWYIQNADLQQMLTVKFSLVFKVPTGTEEFTLTGKAWAEPSMSWLTANMRNVFGDLADKFKNLFRRRDEAASDLARGAAETWTLTLPG